MWWERTLLSTTSLFCSKPINWVGVINALCWVFWKWPRAPVARAAWGVLRYWYQNGSSLDPKLKFNFALELQGLVAHVDVFFSLVTENTENTQFSAVFSYLLRDIAVKFCIWLCFTVPQIKFECRQFLSSFVGVIPLLELKILEIHCFPQFSPTCFDILLWNFAYDFVLLYYRSSSSVVNFRLFL